MLERAGTNEIYISDNPRNTSYINHSICLDWYNYQNFAYWMDNYISSLNQNMYNNYMLDKDLLQWGIKNKIYSPQTCCIVPELINLTLITCNVGNDYVGITKNNWNHYCVEICKYGKPTYIGTYADPDLAFLMYKEAKESYLRELADYYYSINAIHKDVRDMLYRIDIQPDGSEKIK
jgi:hypothetical protein